MAKKKGARSMNPADAHRKEQRKKEIKKNKAERMRVRKVAMAVKDTTKLESELAKLTGKEKQGLLDKSAKLKKQVLEEKLNKIVEMKKSMGVKYEPISSKDDGAGAISFEIRDPTRSVYYHPLLNPHGTPPPGKPHREIEEGGVPAYPPQKDTTDDESDEDEDSDSDESEDSDEEVNDQSEVAAEDIQTPIEPQPAASLSQPRPAKRPDEPPPLPSAPQPEQRWNLFGCLPEQPAVLFPRKTLATTHPFPLRPPTGFPRQHPSYPGPPPFPGQQFYPPAQMPLAGFSPTLPHAAYPPAPYMSTRPQGSMHNYAPPGQPPNQTHRLPPVYHHPPYARQLNNFPGSFAPGPPGITHSNQRLPTSSQTTPRAFATPHPAPLSTPINMSSAPQAVVEPDESTIISASPQIRDFQKEVTALVPTQMKRKRPANTKTSAISRPTGTVRPSINAAPDLGDDDEADDISTPASSTTNPLVASIFGTNGPLEKLGEVSSEKMIAAPIVLPQTVNQPKAPTAADEYARFMQEMGSLIEEK